MVYPISGYPLKIGISYKHAPYGFVLRLDSIMSSPLSAILTFFSSRVQFRGVSPRTVDPKSIDITAWLAYFTDGVAVSIEEVKKKVIGLSKDIKALKDKGQIALTKRQMNIVEKIIQNEKVAIGEVSKEFGITRQAALKEMNKLIDLKVVKLKGKGRGAFYILV